MFGILVWFLDLTYGGRRVEVLMCPLVCDFCRYDYSGYGRSSGKVCSVSIIFFW